MLIAGIVSEYNPFHLGHAALIKQIRLAGATHVVAAMSGNFVQRGEPAILSKWARTRQALLCGVDLVIELPLPWALAGAEKFAYGSVSLLDALGVDLLGFGSECGNIKELQEVAQALLSHDFRGELHRELKRGVTFARARQAAIASHFGETKALLLAEPNNILGIEYLKALHRLDSKISPFTVNRVGAGHNGLTPQSGIASASYIRKLIQTNCECSEFMPKPAADVLTQELQSGRAPASILRIERAVLAGLRRLEPNQLLSFPDVGEGLENRIYSAVRSATSLGELYDLVKSKRYTHARIRRIILSAFLNLSAAAGEGLPPYLRVIGFNSRGKEILHTAKSTTKLPIITNSSDILSLDRKSKNMVELEGKSTDLFALCMPVPSPCGLDLTTGIISI